MQVEQTKNTIASRHLLFLYIDNIIYKKKVGVHDKKKNSSHQIGQIPLKSMKGFFSSIRMSPKTWLNQNFPNTILKFIGSFYIVNRNKNK